MRLSWGSGTRCHHRGRPSRRVCSGLLGLLVLQHKEAQGAAGLPRTSRGGFTPQVSPAAPWLETMAQQSGFQPARLELAPWGADAESRSPLEQQGRERHQLAGAARLRERRGLGEARSDAGKLPAELPVSPHQPVAGRQRELELRSRHNGPNGAAAAPREPDSCCGMSRPVRAQAAARRRAGTRAARPHAPTCSPDVSTAAQA